jgi:hypothetical protein
MAMVRRRMPTVSRLCPPGAGVRSQGRLVGFFMMHFFEGGLLAAIDFGVEIVSTDGKPPPFTFSDFSIIDGRWTAGG